MATNVQQQIRDCIEEFVCEFDALVRRTAVESVSQALQGKGTSRRSPRAAAHAPALRSRTRRKGQKRDRRELQQLTERLLAHITKNAGQRIEQIAEEMGATTHELKLPAKKLIADKKIRTRGVKRATAYFTHR